MISIIKGILTAYLVLGLVHAAFEYATMALGYYAYKKGIIEFDGKDKDMLNKAMDLYPELTDGGIFKNLYSVCKDIVLWPKELLGGLKVHRKINDQIKIKF